MAAEDWRAVEWTPADEILPSFTAFPDKILFYLIKTEDVLSKVLRPHRAMPPSQLKRLKASLREQGIIGPQQSKKQKKQNAQNGVAKEKRVHRNVALNGIREQFNPFEFKEPSRKPKFDVTTEHAARIVRRPGVQKSQEEEMVRI